MGQWTRNFLYWMRFLGFDPGRLLHLRFLPRYFSDVVQYKRLGGPITSLVPVLMNYKQQAGVSNGAYFHHDLLVAQFIYENNPEKHLDIGSRVDGFVAHVASFRKVYVMDIRPLSSSEHENISFIQQDLMEVPQAQKWSSISCLNALEHFGLGRYGDTLNIKGPQIGISNISQMLTPGGTLYLAVPFGREHRIEFNSQIIYSISELKELILGFSVMRFDYVDGAGMLLKNVNFDSFHPTFRDGCAILTLQKTD